MDERDTVKNLYMTKTFTQFMVTMFLFLGLTACGSDEKPLNQYINDIKSRPARSIEPIPKFEQPPKFAYPENKSRRSPFKPIQTAQTADSKAPNMNRPKQPLEAFPIDGLKFVGTVEVGRVRWALISQPNGMISRVKPGDYIGKDFGQIQQITKDNIRVEETLKVGDRWENRTVNIKLRTPDGSR